MPRLSMRPAGCAILHSDIRCWSLLNVEAAKAAAAGAARACDPPEKAIR